MHRTVLTRLVSAVYRWQMAYMNRLLADSPVGGGSYVILMYVQENPGITQARLSSLLAIDRATVSKIVARLTKDGLVRCEPDPIDGRLVRLEVAPRGEDVCRRLGELIANYRAMALDGVSQEEYAASIAALEKILANIRKSMDSMRQTHD